MRSHFLNKGYLLVYTCLHKTQLHMDLDFLIDDTISYISIYTIILSIFEVSARMLQILGALSTLNEFEEQIDSLESVFSFDCSIYKLQIT